MEWCDSRFNSLNTNDCQDEKNDFANLIYPAKKSFFYG